jgi:hypothetical protein
MQLSTLGVGGFQLQRALVNPDFGKGSSGLIDHTRSFGHFAVDHERR